MSPVDEPVPLSDGNRRPWNRVAFMAVVVVVVAAIIRCWGLGQRPLWLDEAFSALYARLDVGTLIELRRNGTNPPLYHILLKQWVEWFGDSEVALRSLSVVAGTSAVALMFPLARSMGGIRTGIVATVLLAINNMAVGYSQEARYYAITGLLSITGALLLRKAVATRRSLWFVSYTLMMIAFVWIHLFAWFVLAAHCAAVLYLCLIRIGQPRRRRTLVVRFGLSVIVILASFTPWAGVLMGQVEAVLDGYWIARPDTFTLLSSLHAFVVPLVSLRWFLVLAACGGIALSVARRAQHSPCDSTDRTLRSLDRALLACWAVLPIFIPLAWSLVAAPIYQIKYTLVAQPAVIVLLSLLITRRPVVGLAALALPVVAHPPAPNRGLQFEDWRSAAAVVKVHAGQRSLIYICQDYAYYALEYYLDDELEAIPVVRPGGEPSEFAEIYPVAALAYPRWLEQLRQRDQTAIIVLSRLRSGQNPLAMDTVWKDLESFGTLRQEQIGGDVDVLIWTGKTR